jgi:hypothetical protein
VIKCDGEVMWLKNERSIGGYSIDHQRLSEGRCGGKEGGGRKEREEQDDSQNEHT